MKKSESGITFIELVITLSIVLILTALITVGSGFVGTDRIRSTSREVLADLQWIRQSAMTQGEDTSVPQLRGFGIRFESEHNYRLFRFNDSNMNFQYDGVPEEASLSKDGAISEKTIPQTVEFRMKSRSTLVRPRDEVLIFDHLGIPRQANFGVSQLSVVIQNQNAIENQKKCISISFNRIREGIWDGSNCQEQ